MVEENEVGRDVDEEDEERHEKHRFHEEAVEVALFFVSGFEGHVKGDSLEGIQKNPKRLRNEGQVEEKSFVFPIVRRRFGSHQRRAVLHEDDDEGDKDDYHGNCGNIGEGFKTGNQCDD